MKYTIEDLSLGINADIRYFCEPTKEALEAINVSTQGKGLFLVHNSKLGILYPLSDSESEFIIKNSEKNEKNPKLNSSKNS
jgi:hypothetical protein